MKSLRSYSLPIAAALAVATICAGAVETARTRTGRSVTKATQLKNSIVSSTFGDCGIPDTNRPPDAAAGVNRDPGNVWDCIPPYNTPVYAKAADDSVVFGSLLE